MCLYNPEKVDTGGKDIKVYKVIIAEADSCGSVSYRSPYFRFMKNSVWNMGETNHSEPFAGSHDESVVKWTINEYGEEERAVSDNAFHSFEKLSDAIDELSYLRRRKNTGICPCDDEYAIGRFTIPCDDEYALGRFTIPGDSKYVYVGGTPKYVPSLSIRDFAPSLSIGGFAKSYASESLRFDGLVPNGIYDSILNEDEKRP